MGRIRRTKREIVIDGAVGQRLRNLRLINKLSQTQLGEAINVSFQQIQKYERGTNRVGPRHLTKLTKLFEVPVSAFYRWSRSRLKQQSNQR